MVKAVHTLFQKENPPLIVTGALPAQPDNYKKIPWSSVVPFLDHAYIMTYALHGPFPDAADEVTNHQSALDKTSVGDPLLNIKSAMEFYKCYFHPETLFIGSPLFFTTYANASGGNLPSHYASPYSGPGYNPNEPDVEGELLYKEVVDDLNSGAALGFWDGGAKAFSVYYPKLQMFGSGIDDEALKEVVNYIKSSGYGGSMLWELRGDTNDWHVLHFLQREL